jgi:hypothetical protein
MKRWSSFLALGALALEGCSGEHDSRAGYRRAYEFLQQAGLDEQAAGGWLLELYSKDLGFDIPESAGDPRVLSAFGRRFLEPELLSRTLEPTHLAASGWCSHDILADAVASARMASSRFASAGRMAGPLLAASPWSARALPAQAGVPAFQALEVLRIHGLPSGFHASLPSVKGSFRVRLGITVLDAAFDSSSTLALSPGLRPDDPRSDADLDLFEGLLVTIALGGGGNDRDGGFIHVLRVYWAGKLIVGSSLKEGGWLRGRPHDILVQLDREAGPPHITVEVIERVSGAVLLKGSQRVADAPSSDPDAPWALALLDRHPDRPWAPIRFLIDRATLETRQPLGPPPAAVEAPWGWREAGLLACNAMTREQVEAHLAGTDSALAAASVCYAHLAHARPLEETQGVLGQLFTRLARERPEPSTIAAIVALLEPLAMSRLALDPDLEPDEETTRAVESILGDLDRHQEHAEDAMDRVEIQAVRDRLRRLGRLLESRPVDP